METANYTKIPNYLLAAILSHGFSKRELVILFAIVRKTYGYNKQVDDISISQITEMTGIDKGHVSSTINSLVNHGVLTKKVGQHAFLIGINPTPLEWRKKDKPAQFNSVSTKTVYADVENAETGSTASVVISRRVEKNIESGDVNKATTATVDVVISSNSNEISPANDDLVIPHCIVRGGHSAVASNMLRGIPDAQLLLDTVDATARSGLIKKSPLALLAGLISRYQSGTYEKPSHATLPHKKGDLNINVTHKVDHNAVMAELANLQKIMRG